MRDLIPVQYDGEQPAVLGRDLHEALGVKTAYKDWFPRMCEYGFSEGIDFCSILSESTGGRPAIDHRLTIAMAKEICMIQRTERGKQCRQWFLQLEAQWNTPEAVMARALRMAEHTMKDLQVRVAELTVENQAMLPKAQYFDGLVDRHLLTSFRETAKLFGVGERELLSLLMEKKYLYRDRRGKLLPYAAKNDGLFALKECFNESTGWVGTQTLVTSKGRETLYRLFL